jgi:hypothetical protein
MTDLGLHIQPAAFKRSHWQLHTWQLGMLTLTATNHSQVTEWTSPKPAEAIKFSD